MVIVVELEMLIKMVDSRCENGNLYFGRACVAFVSAVVGNDLLFLFLSIVFHLKKIFLRSGIEAGGG